MNVQIPKLPGVLVALLGTLSTVLAAVGPTLNSPYREIVVALLAVLASFGYVKTNAALVLHSERERLAGYKDGKAEGIALAKLADHHVFKDTPAAGERP